MKPDRHHQRLDEFHRAHLAGSPTLKLARFTPSPDHEHSAARSVPAVPRDQWPYWAKAMRCLATSEDAGVGDTIAREIGSFTSRAFNAWHILIFNKPCQCAARQAQWNAQYPYVP